MLLTTTLGNSITLCDIHSHVPVLSVLPTNVLLCAGRGVRRLPAVLQWRRARRPMPELCGCTCTGARGVGGPTAHLLRGILQRRRPLLPTKAPARAYSAHIHQHQVYRGMLMHSSALYLGRYTSEYLQTSDREIFFCENPRTVFFSINYIFSLLYCNLDTSWAGADGVRRGVWRPGKQREPGAGAGTVVSTI